MALYQTNAGDRILAADINQYYQILKGVAASGESISLIYNAAGSLILQPSSDPATGTELIQIKNNAGTVQSALSSDGKSYWADGVVGTPAMAFESEKTTGMWRPAASTLAWSLGGTERLRLTATTLTLTGPGITLTAGVVTLPSGAVGAPSLTIAGSLTTGVYSGAANTLNIAANGTNVAQFVDGATPLVLNRSGATESISIQFSLAGVSKWVVGDGITANQQQFVIYDGVAGAARFLADASGTDGSTTVAAKGAGQVVLNGTGGVKIGTRPAFVASDKYLVVDSNGNVHVSGLGPAS